MMRLSLASGNEKEEFLKCG